MVVMIGKLALPLRVGPSGAFVVLDQDSPDDVAQSVRVLLTTVQGTRVEAPDYGVPEWAFADPDVSTAEAACREWEPRATVTVNAAPATWDELVWNVTAEVGSQ